jgi:serine phosphatase RsbU (regulator of sigma subunit)
MNEPDRQPFDPFYALARRLYPGLELLKPEERAIPTVNILGVLFATPLAVAGLIWLVISTNWNVYVHEWPTLLAVAAALVILTRLRFYMIIDISQSGGNYGNAAGTFEGGVLWSAAFLFGPSVLWLDLLLSASQLIFARNAWKDAMRRWATARDLTFTLVNSSLISLTALACYRAWGGTFPLPDLTLSWLLLGTGTILVKFVLELTLLGLGYLGYTLWAMRDSLTPRLLLSLPALLFLGLVVPHIANLFAAPLAGIYSGHGLPAYLVFILAVILVAVLARQMSRSGEAARQQSIQLEKLEALGRAILNAPPDASALPEILAEHAPAMFTFSHMGIWIGKRALLLRPAEWKAEDREPIRRHIEGLREARAYDEKEPLPWSAERDLHAPVITAPILDAESGEPLGSIYVRLMRLDQFWDKPALAQLLPSVQGLAAQVASALQQARAYEQTIAHQKTQQELAVARQIQTGFLPHEIPVVPGWQLAASLEPAREMSGDFYDLIPLPGGRLGLLIADVADKGVGPALYMALSRTLIRTFALQQPDHPERVLEAANRRILADAGFGLFVTAFYGVLDPAAGTLTYANAGHNPPWVLAPDQERIALRRTGMALGADENVSWTRAVIPIPTQGLLFLYTDGASDAQNGSGHFFGEGQLAAAIESLAARTADEIHAGVVAALRAHIGDAPQFDDITLVVVKRK